MAAAERATGLRTTVPLGARLPLTAGSGAQVLWPGNRRRRWRLLLERAEFSDRSLAEVRRRGWAQSVGQREAGVASVSAPVFGAGRQVVAADLGVRTDRTAGSLTRASGWAPVLTAAAQRLQGRLG